MKFPAVSSDKLAIGLSFLCVGHCLGLPLLIIFLPSIAALSLQQEAFHVWMVIAVIPISLYALTLGCKKHKQLGICALGVAGLFALISAVLFGESHLGEAGEKVATLFGAILLALAHYQNYQRCKKVKNCPCN